MTTVDVGDAFEIVFTTAPGATVFRSWFDPADFQVGLAEQIAEYPVGTGNFPYTFQATWPGVWTARVNVSGTATAVEEHHVFARALPGEKPLAVLGHITEQFGDLTAAQEGLTKSLLRAASKLVRSMHPGIDRLVAAGSLDAEVVALGVTNMVLRVLRNPKGLRAETIGPFSRTFDTSVAAGELVITAGETALFTAVVEATPVAPVGTIRLASGLMPPVPSGVYRGGF